MQSIFDTTERLEREAVAAIPDGVYTAEGFQDNDFQSEEHVPVKVKITVQGSEIAVDTHGSSWQRPGCTNCGLIQTLSAIRLAYKFLIRPDLGVTGGSFRSLSIEVELGSIFAAQEPTACLQYGSHTMLLVDLILKALAPALPDRVVAGLPGDAWNVIIIGPHPAEQGLFMCLESTAGGWGASAHDDGDSGVIHFAAGDFKNLPVETLENKYPVRVHQYAVGTDTGGAGRFRGGLNIVRDYEVVAENSDLSLWFERTVTPQWGLFGGRAGAVPKVIMKPDSDLEYVLLKANHNPIVKGTQFRAFTGGGGGYGLPWERDVWRVRADVIDGYVSRTAAANEYGVYFEGNSHDIDEARTEKARAQLARENQS
jgi:N-methylhydantoinase B